MSLRTDTEDRMPSEGYPLNRWWWYFYYIRENLRWSFNIWEQGERLVTFLIFLITAILVGLGVFGAELLNALEKLELSEKVLYGLGAWLALLFLVITPARMWKASQTTSDEIMLEFIEKAIRTGRNFRLFVDTFTAETVTSGRALVDDWHAGIHDELNSYRPLLAKHFIAGPESPIDYFTEDGNFIVEGLRAKLENGISALMEIRSRIEAKR